MVFRLFLHTKDVMVTHEVSEKTARQIIREINSHYDTPKRSYVSTKSYCEYFHVDKEDVVAILNQYYAVAS